MKKILLLLTLNLIYCNSYSQEDYVLIGKKNNDCHYIKIEESLPDKCSVWLKIDHNYFAKNRKGKKYLVKVGHQMTFLVLYCKEKLYDNLDYIIYDKDGRVEDSGNKLEYKKKIFPETIRQAFRHLAKQDSVLTRKN